MARLTLDTTGIRSPLDLGAGEVIAEPSGPHGPHRLQGLGSVNLLERISPPEPASPVAPSCAAGAGPFFGGGRPIQTSIALDVQLVEDLEKLARAGAVSLNALLVAVLHAGLPAGVEEARRAAVHERADHRTEPRAERNIRLPAQLRARVDQLIAHVRDVARRANRADLANAALRASAPDTAEAAAELVAAYQRRTELQALVT